MANENKVQEQQDWQRFVDVNDNKSCIAYCKSLRVKFIQAVSELQGN